MLGIDLDGEEVSLTLYNWATAPFKPPAMFPHSVARPKFYVERGPSSNPAPLTVQLPFERHKARVAGPALQQCSVRNDRLVPAGVAARAHQMEHA